MDEQSLTALSPGLGTCVAFKIMHRKDLMCPSGLETMWLEEISHLRHPNLLTPFGYCFTTDKTIFAYEFVPRGSLDNHLFRRGQEPLPWSTRIKVVVGAARALNFLHGLETPVVNGNLTINDILLDHDFNAKLSNVGFSIEVFIPRQELEFPGLDYGISNAPEYKLKGNLSTKSDVYSFGVVLVKLISGLRALDRYRSVSLIEWATPYLGNKRTLREVMDIRLEREYPQKQAWKAAQLAVWCLSPYPRSRPTLADVVAVLQLL